MNSTMGSNESENLDDKMNSSTENCTTDKGLKLMEKMGYIRGMGLGKTNKVSNVIEISMKQNRHGFGFENKTEFDNTSWDIANESVEVREKLEWLSSNLDLSDFSLENLKRWMVFEPRVDEYPNDNKFCDPILQHNLQEAKELLELFEPNELRRIRSRANPFENIRNVFFLNRAALKMANIDAACNFMFTTIENDTNHFCPNKPCYFADVCAGPGGFSEYILWKKKWFYKGFGFTLKEGENDFMLNKFFAGSPETFQTLYGKKQDGNVYDPENISDLMDKVLSQTDNKGVHFMMSDGGFCVDGNENLQELLSKQLYLCQCLVALSIVRDNGHFVTKLFDTFTLFSVGLIYLMYRCFEEVCILKPNASRPANSERYLICKRKKSNTDCIRDYLKEINGILWSSKELDITSIVPYDILIQDTKFYNFIVKTNNSLCKRQIISLNKIMAFSKDLTLVEYRQADLRSQCLQYWNIPDVPRTPPTDLTPDEYLRNLYSTDFFMSPYVYIKNKAEMSERFKKDKYKICFLNDNEKLPYKFYLGCGGKKVYEFIGNRWQLTTNVNIELPRGTLLVGELVKEIVFENRRKPKNVYCLHVIDAYQLGHLNISETVFDRRRELIQIFCEAINQPYHSNSTNIRMKPIYSLESFTTSNDFKISHEKDSERIACHLSSTDNLPTVFHSGTILFINCDMKWDKDTTITSISNFEKYDCLWNIGSKDYKNQQKKKDAWCEIAKILNMDVESVEKKMKSLLAAYRRERKRENDSMKSGAGRDEIYKSKWFAFQRFKFLSGINKPKKTRNSMKEHNVSPDDESFSLEASQFESNTDVEMETEIENKNNFDDFNDTTQLVQETNPEIVQLPPKNLKVTKLGKLKQMNMERSSPTLEKVCNVLESFVEHKKLKKEKETDVFSIYGELVASKIRNLETKQEQAIVQNQINQILFQAEMGYYRQEETYSRPSTSNSVDSEISISTVNTENQSQTAQSFYENFTAVTIDHIN